MKEILKKAMIPIFLSIIIGGICGRVVYKIYLGNTNLIYEGNLIYLIQSGAYTSYDNMRANTIGYDYVYYEEDNMYKTVIGVTKNKKNIEKIKDIYGNNIIINEYYVEDNALNNKIIEYDKKLSNEEDNNKIKEIIGDMLYIYKDKNNAKLIKIS